MLYHGLYEQVINNALNRELAEIPEARKSTAPIDTAEAAKVLAQYLTDVVQKGLENVQDNGGGIEAQIQLANQIVTTIQNTTQVAGFRDICELAVQCVIDDLFVQTGVEHRCTSLPFSFIIALAERTFNDRDLPSGRRWYV